MNDHTYAIIPALNEEQTIGAVITNLLEHGVTQVIVVDNGSTDTTSAVARAAGARVVPEQEKGYGRACLAGIAALPDECQWVLFCDADGSDDLQDLPKLAEQQEEHDFILGNRRATPEGRSNLTGVQNFGNWLSGFLMKLGWGQGFSDLGPLRLIRKESLASLEMQDQNFGWTVEMQAKSLDQKLRTTEVPVNYLPRQGGQSKISGNLKASIQAGTIILSTLAALWINRPVIRRFFAIFSVLTLLVGATITGFWGDPASAEKGIHFFWGIGIMSAGFLLALAYKDWKLWQIFAIAIITRALLLPMPPGDDIWRYIWEGLVQSHGVNPYNTPPLDTSLSELRTDWWPLINHPEVTAIYPPLAQLIFRIIASISPSVLAFKLIITLADLSIGCLLAKRFGAKALLYLLNPMVIYCFAGGAHYESLFLLPLVAATLIWDEQKSWKTMAVVGLLVGASISIKLVAILAAGFIGWRLLLRQFSPQRNLSSLIAYLASALAVPLLSYGLFSALQGTPQNLYPKEFATVARSTELLPWITEFFNSNPDKPIVNKVFAIPLVLILIPITLCTKQLSTFIVRSTLALLFCAPMVHAWYLTWIIPFAQKRYIATTIAFSVTGFFYFILPYRYAAEESWTLTIWERLLFWSPLLLIVPELIQQLARPLRGAKDVQS